MLPNVADHRRLRLVRDRRPGRRSGSARASRPTGVTRVHALRRHHRRARRGDAAAGRARLGRDRARARCAAASRIGYYNDPEKTAETFVEVDGERWVLTGDMATVEADGTITLLGRGSAVHQHRRREGLPRGGRGRRSSAPRGVYDALVVGVPDERWGQRVAAVVAAGRRRRSSTLDDARGALPRRTSPATRCPSELVFVDQVAALAGGQGRLPLGEGRPPNA